MAGVDIANTPYEQIRRGEVIERVAEPTASGKFSTQSSRANLANSVSRATSGVTHSISKAIEGISSSDVKDSVSRAASGVGHSVMKAIENLPQPKEVSSNANKDEASIQKDTDATISKDKESLSEILEGMQKQVDAIPTTAQIEKQYQAKAKNDLQASKQPVETLSEKREEQPSISPETAKKVEEAPPTVAIEKPTEPATTKEQSPTETPAATMPPKKEEKPSMSTEMTNKVNGAPASAPGETTIKDAAIKDEPPTDKAGEPSPQKKLEEPNTLAEEETKKQEKASEPYAVPAEPSTQAMEAPPVKQPPDTISQLETGQPKEGRDEGKEQEKVPTTTIPVDISTQVIAKKYEALVEEADKAAARREREESRVEISEWFWDSRCTDRVGLNGPCIRGF